MLINACMHIHIHAHTHISVPCWDRCVSSADWKEVADWDNVTLGGWGGGGGLEYYNNQSKHTAEAFFNWPKNWSRKKYSLKWHKPWGGVQLHEKTGNVWLSGAHSVKAEFMRSINQHYFFAFLMCFKNRESSSSGCARVKTVTVMPPSPTTKCHLLPMLWYNHLDETITK